MTPLLYYLAGMLMGGIIGYAIAQIVNDRRLWVIEDEFSDRINEAYRIGRKHGRAENDNR
jgi:hypothetical protein